MRKLLLAFQLLLQKINLTERSMSKIYQQEYFSYKPAKMRSIQRG
jgi:hypothetical protein